MTSSRKKVIVRKWVGEPLLGYLPPEDFLEQDAVGDYGLRLLDMDGNVTSVRIEEVKWLCFVRDFVSGDQSQPERLLQRTFPRRPRNPGLWVRVRLKDNDSLEGLAKNDLSLLDNGGLVLIPPDTRSNTQRIFLPRQAIAQAEILAVVKMRASRKTVPPLQETLFKSADS